MTNTNANLFTRNDTIFGVCEALGEDFGINPNWLRVGFAIPLIYNPVLAIIAYTAMAVIVAASRFAFPRKSAAPFQDVAADAPNLAPAPAPAIAAEAPVETPVYAQAA